MTAPNDPVLAAYETWEAARAAHLEHVGDETPEDAALYESKEAAFVALITTAPGTLEGLAAQLIAVESELEGCDRVVCCPDGNELDVINLLARHAKDLGVVEILKLFAADTGLELKA